jgi:hypothetical protein
LNIKGETTEGELELIDVNNHDTDAEFHFSSKITDNELAIKVKSQYREIQEYIKLLFISFWDSQKK